jgi:hypothetical protein
MFTAMVDNGHGGDVADKFYRHKEFNEWELVGY